jgi:hypothetical protein
MLAAIYQHLLNKKPAQITFKLIPSMQKLNCITLYNSCGYIISGNKKVWFKIFKRYIFTIYHNSFFYRFVY